MRESSEEEKHLVYLLPRRTWMRRLLLGAGVLALDLGLLEAGANQVPASRPITVGHGISSSGR